MASEVITRFAPSPTGLLHIGGARTALFAWFYAKTLNGKCLLRIEDTDKQRSKQEYTDAIIESFSWMGVGFDGDVVFQSENKANHLKAANDLLSTGNAYHCNCTTERLSQLREEQQKLGQNQKYDGKCRNLNLKEQEGVVVRFKNPSSGKVVFNDVIRGEIEIDNKELDDLILIRSDGSPTYNLSVVVDDKDMQITHVIRGDDHINNTPKQINIFKALGIKEPAYGHVPMILGEDGKRMSKRHGAVGVKEYELMGVLPKAFLNYLTRLGWSLGDQEIFNLKDLISSFKDGSLNKSPAAFSMEKLKWFNKEYLSKKSTQEILDLLLQTDSQFTDSDYSRNVIDLVKDRCSLINDFLLESKYFFTEIQEYDQKAVSKNIKDNSSMIIKSLHSKLETAESLSPEEITIAIEEVMVEFEVGFGKVGLPFRIALTGSTSSPSIDQTASLLGKSIVQSRLLKFIEEFSP
jgi:glutamyl-tRNA synthetase|tara:strand:+ start:1279 stop:2667 length:1389 start_codon:yes stop_codon:yes gene_type:complete